MKKIAQFPLKPGTQYDVLTQFSDTRVYLSMNTETHELYMYQLDKQIVIGNVISGDGFEHDAAEYSDGITADWDNENLWTYEPESSDFELHKLVASYNPLKGTVMTVSMQLPEEVSKYINTPRQKRGDEDDE